MGATPDLLNLFTEPPVILLYFLCVILLSQAALFMALGQRMRGGPSERTAARYAAASLGVMLVWIVLMVGAMIVLLTHNPSSAILPPLDRAVSTMVVLLIGWGFLTADQQSAEKHRGGWITAFVVLLITILIGTYGYTAYQWFNTSGQSFNTSIYGIGWTMALAALAAIGLLLLLLRFRSTMDVPLKMIFFVFVLAGAGYTLISIDNGTLRGDDAGAIRLALLAGMPFLPIVIYRMVVDRLLTTIEKKTDEAHQAAINALIVPPPPDTATERESSTLLRALGLMIERDMPEDIPQQITIAVATVLKADVTALLSLDDAEYADVLAAYDNIQQKAIAAMALKTDEQPTLQNAIAVREQRTLSTDRNLNELVDLYTRLDVQKIGPAYFQPLVRDGKATGVLVVALPYTQRDLRENEKQLLEALAPMAARLLNISRTAQRVRYEKDEDEIETVVEGVLAEVPMSAARAEMQTSLELARNQINELSALVRDLQIELDYERSRIAELGADDPEGLSITQRMAKMSTERSQLEAERERLMQALQEAQTKLATTSGNEDELYQAMVRVLQQERDELQAQKAQLEAQLTEIRAHGQVAPAPAVLRDMLTNLSEEKARLAVERDQIKGQLTEVEAELKALGIEGGPTGLATVLLQLTNERSHYKALAEQTSQERDKLAIERKRLTDLIANEGQQGQKIQAMETLLRRLATDREALLHQRDSLRQEREQTNTDRETWEAQRAKLVADMAGLQSELEETVFDRNRAIAELKKMAEDRNALNTERDRLIAERMALQTERDQLMARIEGNRETLQRLGADGVGALKSMIDDLTAERSLLEQQLLQAHADVQALEQQLNRAESRLAHSVQVPHGAAIEATQAEVMLSIAQELRTPMSSIGGYVDLLLGETIGILGALQRQFLQRVKANTDRLATLLEDFIRVTAIDTGQMNLAPESVDTLEIIDDAITATRTQFREKGITLKMDLPDNLPAISADRDALQQIVIQLLSNAYLASPTDGEVQIAARFERGYHIPAHRNIPEEVTDVIYLAIRDMGGGIPSEEQGRVFSRLYRADNPLIQGLGDTGVGLSIARALTEAHGGYIWLESTPGTSSTFKLVLPLHGAPRTERVAHAAS